MSDSVVAPRHEGGCRDVFTTLSTPRAKYSKSRGSGSSGTGKSGDPGVLSPEVPVGEYPMVGVIG